MIVRFRLVGTEPLLMHNQRGANPKDPLAREMKLLAAKRSRLTDEEYEQLSDIEYRLGIYHDEAIGPYIPADNVKCAIQDGARMVKRGKDIERGLWPLAGKIGLDYEGPRTLEELLADPRFRDVRMAGVNNGLIERTRPRFEEWALEASMEADDAMLNLDALADYLSRAGRYSGLGDYRPKYGRFKIDDIRELPGKNGSSTPPEDADNRT